MPILPHHFLTSATSLITHHNETDYRNAASRAYYSAFHEAVPIANFLPNPQKLRITGIHQEIINKFTQNSELALKNIGYLLQKCKLLRVKADYKLQAFFTYRHADNAIKLATQITSLLQQLSSPQQKLQVIS